MLSIESTGNRLTRSFSLRVRTLDTIEQLAKAYGTNSSRIVEALVSQYGPKILQQQKEEEKQA